MLDIIYAYYLEIDKPRKEILHENTLEALGAGNRKWYTDL